MRFVPRGKCTHLVSPNAAKIARFCLLSLLLEKAPQRPTRFSTVYPPLPVGSLRVHRWTRTLGVCLGCVPRILTVSRITKRHTLIQEHRVVSADCGRIKYPHSPNLEFRPLLPSFTPSIVRSFFKSRILLHNPACPSL